MSSKAKLILTSIIAIIILIVGVTIFSFWNKGFIFLTYATNNKVEEQLEEVLERESEVNYKNRINNLGFKSFKDEYLGFFEVDNDDKGEVFIVSYQLKGSFGNNKILSLNRIVKGYNSIVLINGFSSEKDNVILAGIDKSVYSAINILDKESEKILKEIDLENDQDKSYISQKLNQKYFIMDYVAEGPEGIKLELVKKSGN